MDIELARTFLEIVKTGSFIAAGEHLHVTQTTVTARVRNLESQLGCRLFVRNRAGARVTADGELFIAHASQLVKTWEAARRELPLPVGSTSMLTLAGETSLWDPLLLNWLSKLRQNRPDIAVRIEVGHRVALHGQIKQGLIDAALVHQPDYAPGLQVEQLIEEKLIQVSSAREEEPYIYVDWGEHFRRQHDAALPDLARCDLYIGLGPLALQYLIQHGGRGYFRTRVVQPYLDDGVVNVVRSAPEFSYPVYVIYSQERKTALLDSALESLSTVIGDL